MEHLDSHFKDSTRLVNPFPDGECGKVFVSYIDSKDAKNSEYFVKIVLGGYSTSSSLDNTTAFLTMELAKAEENSHTAEYDRKMSKDYDYSVEKDKLIRDANILYKFATDFLKNLNKKFTEADFDYLVKKLNFEAF